MNSCAVVTLFLLYFKDIFVFLLFSRQFEGSCLHYLSFHCNVPKFLGDFYFILTFLESKYTRTSGKLNMIGKLYFNQTHWTKE